MSSSVFTESSSAKTNADDSVENGNMRCGGTQSNNVVVVYGKNGITVDPNGLERLMDEDSISSLSVIRISSPTPSMQSDEKEEATNEKIQMATDGIELLSNLDFSGDADKNSGELVGLTVEEFYPPEEAKKLAKEILNYAGLTKRYDYDFLRYVTENDHCYTPLKVSNDLKLQECSSPQSSQESTSSPTVLQYGKNNRIKEAGENVEFIEEKQTDKAENDDEAEEESDYTSTSISDSDNDRDSDLDFNVNDRGRRRKTSVRRAKKITPKVAKKRHSFTDKDSCTSLSSNTSFEEDKKTGGVQRNVNRQTTDSRKNLTSTQMKTPVKNNVMKTKPAQQITQMPSTQKSQIQQSVQKQPQQEQVVSKSQPLPQMQKEQYRVISESDIAEQQLQALESQSRNNNQFINVTSQSSTSGGVSTTSSDRNKARIVMLNGSNISESQMVTNDNNSESKIIHTLVDSNATNAQNITINRTIHQQQTKGFMPLVADAATKSQLPAQISIQTHNSISSIQNSTDLAAEHDKQLDLIDSIVKDEMNKSSIIIKDPPMNENIPQIVKMLENTEKAVLNKHQTSKTISLTSSRAYNRVEDIDITNAPLLDSAEDELTEDLLQHVANLLDEDKNVEQALEAHVLMTSAHGSQSESTNVGEMFMKNLETTQNTPSISLNAAQKQLPAAVKKDPIQIVRGDGRVITLPPIEAPTTRAKRRAQTQSVDIGTPHQTSRRKSSSDSRGHTSNSRRNSATEQKVCNTRKRNSTSAQSTPKMEEGDEGETDDETEGSSDSEDDPNRLWCICRQPHNNRFMICCDKCEDWFHGTCVNITKAMGLEMETKGVEWTCPKCLKLMDPGTKRAVQRKITEIFEKRGTSDELVKTPETKKLNLSTRKTENQRKSIDSSKKMSDTKGQKKIVDVIKQPTENEMIKTPTTRVLNLGVVSQPITSTPSRSMIQSGFAATPTSTPPTPEVKVQKQEPIPIMVITPSGQVHHPPKNDDKPTTFCIVCKKSARQNSVYCSDECIRIYAQNAIHLKAPKTPTTSSQPTTPSEEKKKKTFSSFEEALAQASEPTFHQVKNKIERVCVFERKSGRILAGNNAPTTVNLKKWLQDNPTFEIVQPGSPQALAIEKSKQKQKLVANVESSVKKPQEPHKVIKTVSEQQRHTPSPKLRKYPQQVSLKPGTPQSTTPTNEKVPVEVKVISNEHNKSGSQERKTSLDDHVKSPTHSKSLKKQTSLDQNQQQHTKTQQPHTSTPNSTKDAEPIRLNVKRTLKEQLMARMSELNDPYATKLTEDEVESFSNQTEHEMFKLFNKDTGSKYKAKYRSLMFNIKDRKNQTLFQKICEKIIEPKQLVRMSAEEMASQELTEWRQNENKHQLEMIKKSELDLLSCAKNYVLKTHKGEEVIESKSTDRVSLDITIPVEDVVTVLNNSSVVSSSTSVTGLSEKEFTKSGSLSLSHDGDDSFKNISSTGAGNSSKTTNGNNSSTSEKKKSKNKGKDKERERGRDREKQRDKEREREKERGHDRDRNYREHDKRHRSKEKHKSRKRSRSRSRERRHKQEKIPRLESHSNENSREAEMRKKEIIINDIKEKSVTTTPPHKKEVKEIKVRSKTEHTSGTENYSLIDQILESTKTVEEAANLVALENEKILKRSLTPNEASGHQVQTNENSMNDGDSDQEPTSTVVIPPTPEEMYKKYANDLQSIIWSGSINMIDVATFQIIVQPVGGISTELEKDLPIELDVVGRISPDTVWDYISKIKKSPNKEIVLIRLVPTCDTENVAYSALYSYLDKRKRLGVVKTISSYIKDFYILPLGGQKNLPSIIQPKDNVEFFEDGNRPDLLIGIVIRIMKQKQTSLTSGPQLAKMRKSIDPAITNHPRTASLEDGRFTPPHSPKRSSKKTDIKSIISVGRLPSNTDPIDVKTIVTPQTQSTAYIDEDADEPYSPGGSSDDDITTTSLTKDPILPSNATPDELKRKMEEINRQIEAQKLEIAGMLNLDPQAANKIYSPSDSPTSSLKPALANISLPPNLHEILSSIKSTEPTPPVVVPPAPIIGPVTKDEEICEDGSRTPPAPPPPPKIVPTSTNETHDISNPENIIKQPSVDVPASNIVSNVNQTTSRLAQLSEAELLRMVPDDIDFVKTDTSDTKKSSLKHPHDSSTNEDIAKKPRWDDTEPPPPGLEDEFM